jgi:hypothetical protein
MVKLSFPHSPPWNWRQAFKYIISEVLSGEVAVLEQRAGLHFNITNRAKLLYQCAEGVKRADRL